MTSLSPSLGLNLPMIAPETILLVGASGRVGRMICHHWHDAGSARLLATARQPVGVTLGAPASLAWSPLKGPDGLLDCLARSGTVPAAMVVLAGVTPRKGQDPAELAENSALAQACLNAAHMSGIGRVLLASSSAVYGVDTNSRAFDESCTPQPAAPYGLAKWQMETAAEPWRQKGVQVCALRIGNVAGADALLGQAMAPGAELRIDAFADGLGPLRSYIGPASLARVLCDLALLPAALPPAVNIAAPSPVRMTDLCRAAKLPYVLVPAAQTAHQSITLGCGILQSFVVMGKLTACPM
jgi:UDP-glucose 4-epimerase